MHNLREKIKLMVMWDHNIYTSYVTKSNWTNDFLRISNVVLMYEHKAYARDKKKVELKIIIICNQKLYMSDWKEKKSK